MLNVTVPVGVPKPGALGYTMAVSCNPFVPETVRFVALLSELTIKFSGLLDIPVVPVPQ